MKSLLLKRVHDQISNFRQSIFTNKASGPSKIVLSILFLVMFSVQSFSQVNPDLVGYWKMDQNSGTNVNDETANGLNGTFVGSLFFTQSGAFPGAGNALNFSGGYVSVPNNPAINQMQNSMTIEAWIFQTDNANNTIVDRGIYNFLFETNPNGQPGLGFYNPNGGWSYSSSSIPVNQWVHVAMTWDGSTKTLKFYTNGTLTDTFIRPSALFFNDSELNIGRQEPDGCRCNLMNGQIDELRLWKVVRSESEIQAAINVIPDDTPPFVDFGSEFTVELDENGHATVTVDAVGGDEFDDNGEPLTFAFSQTDFDCSYTGTPTEITITVTNVAGISASTVMSAIVEDNMGPILVTNDVVVQLDAEGNGSYTNEELFSAETRDNCGGQISFQGAGTVNRDDVAASPFQVVVKGTDQNGNTTRARATITVLDYVVDETPPVAIAQDITVQLDENGTASITPEQINNGSTDNSGGELTYSLDRTDFSCTDLSASCSGSSIEFDGTGIASGANGDNIQNLGLNQLTMEAWVKPNGGTVNSIIRKAGDYDLYMVNNILYAEVWYEGRASSAQYLYTGPNVPSSGWSHVAFTFDKTNNGAGKFYVNGIETVASGAARSITPDITLGIGGSTEFGQSFTGLIDDVRIWSVERTSSEINEFKDFCIDANSVGLEAYFKIEANEGTTLTDYSGNGNHLTISGTSWSTEGAPIESKGIEVTLTVTDEANNTSSAIAKVVVLDNITPSVNLNGDAIINLNQGDTFTETATAEDNCSATLDIQGTVDTATAGTYALTYKATDGSANESAEVTRTVNVLDVTLPIAVAQDIIVQLDVNGNASITAQDVNNGSSDNSGAVSLSIDRDMFNCADIGESAEAVTPTIVSIESQPTHGHGGGYNPNTDEFWYPDYLNGSTIVYVYNRDHVLQRTFDSGQAFVMQLWMDTDSETDYYTANFTSTNRGITRRSGNTTVWYHNLGGLTSGVATDADYVYALPFNGNTISVLDKSTGVLNRTINLPGITKSFGGLVVANGSIYIFGNAVDWGNNSGSENYVHQLTMNGGYIGSTKLESYIGRAVAFDGEIAWISQHDDVIRGFQLSNGSAYSSGGGNDVTLTVTDASGNSATAVSNITVLDEITPTVNLNGDAIITLSQGDTFTETATAEDNCSATLDIQGIVDTATVGTYVLTYKATDGSGNESGTTIRTVNVLDNTPPTAIAQDITVALDANGNASITPEQINNGSTDNSGAVTLSIDNSSFDCRDLTILQDDTNTNGVAAVGNFALDFNGQNGLIDTQSSIFPDAGLNEYTVETWLKSSATTGNHGIISQYIASSGTRFTLYLETASNGVIVFKKGDDPHDVRGSISVNDGQWHHIAVVYDQGNVSLYIDGQLDVSGTNPNGGFASINTVFGAFNTSGAGALDGTLDDIRFWDVAKSQTEIQNNNALGLNGNESGLIGYWSLEDGTGSNVAIDHSMGDHDGSLNNIDVNSDWVGGIQPNQVTLTVTDEAGNTATATATVSVEDNITPVIAAPANISVLATSTAGAVVNYAPPVGTDNCTVTTLLTTGLADGAIFPIGTTTVTYTATDASGNATSASFNVEVEGLAPEIVVPANISISNDVGGCGAIVDYTATETTAIPASTITYDIEPGSSFALGTTVVTATATNAVGTSTKSFTVTVEDNIAPVIAAPANISVFATSTAGAVVNYATPVGTDNCTVTTLLTAGLADGAIFPIGTTTVTYTATDASGNATSASFNVVVEGLAPEIVVPANISISNDVGGCGAIVDYTATETTAIPASVITYDIEPGSNFALGTTVVTATASNAIGTSTKSFTITVSDDELPTVITKDATVTLDANGVYSVNVDDINNGSFDNCNFDLSVDVTILDCSMLGANTVTLTATDASGNTTSETAVITVVDNSGPVIIANDIEVFLDTNGSASIALEDVNGGITDGCGISTTSLDITSFDCSNLGANTVTITATDIHGNTSSQTATVTVIDNIAPTVVTKDITVDLDSYGNASITPDDVLVQEETTEYCSVSNARGYGVLLYRYIKRYRRTSNTRLSAFVFLARGRTFRKNPDGTATITGYMVDRRDASDSWLVTINLKNARTWEEWSALGRTYVGNRNVVGDKYLDWTYYEIAEGSVLRGAGRNRGESILIRNSRGIQVGEGANTLNSDYGMSGLFSYANRRGQTSSGRVYFSLDNCLSNTKTPEGPLTEDNCGIVSTSLDIANFDCSNIGANIVNVTVTDESGNATTVPATVTIRDTVKPIVKAKRVYYAALGPNGSVTIDPAQIDDGSTDNCGIVSYSLSKDTFSCRDTYYRYGQNVRFTVTDASGNSSSTFVNIRVADTEAPVISREPITLVVYGRRRFQVSRRDIESRVTDNCEVGYLYYQRTSFTTKNVGLNYIRVTALDRGGKRTNGYVRVNVVDISQYRRTVPMCYRGRSINVRHQQVQRWLSRGAYIGSCPQNMARPQIADDIAEEISDLTSVTPDLKLSSSPNPTSHYTLVSFSSQLSGPAKVTIYNTNGIEMDNLFDDELVAKRRVEVGYDVGKLPSGIYIIRMVTAGEVKTMKLVVRK